MGNLSSYSGLDVLGRDWIADMTLVPLARSDPAANDPRLHTSQRS